jgi:hypothetical protein
MERGFIILRAGARAVKRQGSVHRPINDTCAGVRRPCLAALTYEFTVLGTHQIVAECEAEGVASARVMQKGGMEYGGRFMMPTVRGIGHTVVTTASPIRRLKHSYLSSHDHGNAPYYCVSGRVAM